MNIVSVILYIVGVGLLGAACILFREQLKSFFSFLANAATGVGVLILMHFLSGTLGFGIGINAFNIALSFLLGIPGVVLLLFLNFLM